MKRMCARGSGAGAADERVARAHGAGEGLEVVARRVPAAEERARAREHAAAHRRFADGERKGLCGVAEAARPARRALAAAGTRRRQRMWLGDEV